MQKGECTISKQTKHPARRIFVWLSIVAMILSIFLASTKCIDAPLPSTHNVYIAFGFHVNLYHSFRSETNDEHGIANDIRVIRHIIQTLDLFNAKGVPVKGIWDFDNLFSLQELLPRYAPDIITDIRRRIERNGDEVILMSYNNGLVSAMTARELDDVVRWSITNPWQTGVNDLFGTYSPIVRPQEMMTTPGTFSIYKKYGIQAVALYYSATPFDAFRVFSRPLSRTEAHNPILYHHPKTGEEMVVIPTYHFGDLVEHVSLRYWTGELHKLQQTRKLNADALIFINFDADANLWEGLDLPWILSWLPNTSGIEGLVSDVMNLPYVRFTTIGDYLDRHSPVSTFYFSQDTADGSYNGYSSWAEKASTSRSWTIIEGNRRACAAAQKAMTLLEKTIDTAQLENLVSFSYMKRLRALSTTHFGMSTPFLAIQRKRDTDKFMDSLANDSQAIMQIITDAFHRHLKENPSPSEKKNGLTCLDTMMVLNADREEKADGSRFLKIPIPSGYEAGMKILLVRSDGKELTIRNLGSAMTPGTTGHFLLSVDEPQALTDGIYHLYAGWRTENDAEVPHGTMDYGPTGISNRRLSVLLDKAGIEGIYLDGVRLVDSGSLTPSIKWKDSLFRALPDLKPPVASADGGSVTLRMTGLFPGPSGKTLSDGWMDYRLTLFSDLPYMILQGSLRYPSTEASDIFKAASREIIHRTDLNWQEVAPAEILFSTHGSRKDPVRILKRNYLGLSSEYLLDYFRFNDRNLNLDSINNHTTESYVGIVAGSFGMGLSMDNSELSNFAFSPLKMRYNTPSNAFTIRANPFGTYYGHQYRPPTWGNGNGFEVTLLTGEQFYSSAPTYNGVSDHFSLMLAFFAGRQLPGSVKRDLIDFANPPVVIPAIGIASAPLPSPSPEMPRGFVASYQDGAVQFSWDSDLGTDGHYRILCGTEPGVYDMVYPAVGNTLRVTRYAEDLPFAAGRQYYAVIESVTGSGRVSCRSPEIRFTILPPMEKTTEVPLKLELKVLWACLYAWLSSFCTQQ